MHLGASCSTVALQSNVAPRGYLYRQLECKVQRDCHPYLERAYTQFYIFLILLLFVKCFPRNAYRSSYVCWGWGGSLKEQEHTEYTCCFFFIAAHYYELAQHCHFSFTSTIRNLCDYFVIDNNYRNPSMWHEDRNGIGTCLIMGLCHWQELKLESHPINCLLNNRIHKRRWPKIWCRCGCVILKY